MRWPFYKTARTDVRSEIARAVEAFDLTLPEVVPLETAAVARPARYAAWTGGVSGMPATWRVVAGIARSDSRLWCASGTTSTSSQSGPSAGTPGCSAVLTSDPQEAAVVCRLCDENGCPLDECPITASVIA